MKRKAVTTETLPAAICHACNQNKVVLHNHDTDNTDTEDFTVCDDCDEKMAKLEEDNSLLYFQSHFDESVVLESSHPHVVNVSPYLVQMDRMKLKPSPSFYEDKKETSHSVLIQNSREAAEILQSASAVLILAGSGMSADSGLSTFRPPTVGAGATVDAGVGKGENVIDLMDSNVGKMHLLALEDACYSTKPEKAWYYDAGYRRAIKSAAPHDGYTKLLCMLKSLQIPWFVVTTNIDRYFTASGFPQEQVYETHGNVDYLQCSKRGSDRCSGVYIWDKSIPMPLLDDNTMTCDISTVPRCSSCGFMSRMNISHLPDEPSDVDNTIKGIQRRKARAWLLAQHKQLLSTQRSSNYARLETEATVTAASAQEANEYNRKRSSNGNNYSLVILEIGCGPSAHGMQRETDLLLSCHPSFGFHQHASLIRINPDGGECPSYLGGGGAARRRRRTSSSSSSDCNKGCSDNIDNSSEPRAIGLECQAQEAIGLISKHLWSSGGSSDSHK